MKQEVKDPEYMDLYIDKNSTENFYEFNFSFSNLIVRFDVSESLGKRIIRKRELALFAGDGEDEMKLAVDDKDIDTLVEAHREYWETMKRITIDIMRKNGIIMRGDEFVVASHGNSSTI
jgi:hypothetical protein